MLRRQVRSMLDDGAICRTGALRLAGSLELELVLLAAKQALQSGLARPHGRLQLEAL